MRFISLFSGIEAASSAWLPLGWTCAAVAEVDGFCCQLLKRKYPNVPNLGDVTAVTEAQIRALGRVDVVIFGSPCQDLSVAGKRAGLAGERSGLFFDAMRIVRWSGARYALWENVPGAFSSNAGADFAAVAGEMAGVCVDVPDGGWRNTGVLLGPAGLVEWAVLDAQWFGVPQRRRRIFALRDSGDWANRPPILFDAESLSGNLAPRRKTREDVTGSLAARTNVGGGLGTDFELGGGYELSPALTGSGQGTERAGDSRGQDCVIPFHSTGDGYWQLGAGTLRAREQESHEHLIASTGETSHCLNAGGMGRIDYETETLVTCGFNFKASASQSMNPGPVMPSMDTGKSDGLCVAFSCKDSGADAGELSPTLRAMEFDGSHANGGGQVAIAFETRFVRNGRGAPDEIVSPLKARSGEDGRGDGASCVAYTETYKYNGINGRTHETNAGKILRSMREEIGEEAFAEWGSGVLGFLWQTQVLRFQMHGGGVRPEASEIGPLLGNGALSCEEDMPTGAVRGLWKEECLRRTPLGRELPEQFSRQLGADLSKLPHQAAQATRLLYGMWESSEGIRVLREALSTIQAYWRPAEDVDPDPPELLNVRELGEHSRALWAALYAGETGGEIVIQQGGQGSASAVRRLTPL